MATLAALTLDALFLKKYRDVRMLNNASLTLLIMGRKNTDGDASFMPRLLPPMIRIIASPFRFFASSLVIPCNRGASFEDFAFRLRAYTADDST